MSSIVGEMRFPRADLNEGEMRAVEKLRVRVGEKGDASTAIVLRAEDATGIRQHRQSTIHDCGFYSAGLFPLLLQRAALSHPEERSVAALLRLAFPFPPLVDEVECRKLVERLSKVLRDQRLPREEAVRELCRVLAPLCQKNEESNPDWDADRDPSEDDGLSTGGVPSAPGKQIPRNSVRASGALRRGKGGAPSVVQKASPAIKKRRRTIAPQGRDDCQKRNEWGCRQKKTSIMGPLKFDFEIFCFRESKQEDFFCRQPHSFRF